MPNINRETHLRHVIFIFALLMCAVAAAEDASLTGVWQLQTPQLWQQLELNKDGTYQRSIVTTGSRRTEIGRWSGEVSVLVLQPDYVITTQGARVPLPPRGKQIDVAGVDANSLTLYYDGDAVETWQRVPRVAASPAQRPRTPRSTRLPVPQVRLVDVQIEIPAMPNFRTAARIRTATLAMVYELSSSAAMVSPVMPVFSVAAVDVSTSASVATPMEIPLPLAPPARPAPTDIYPEANVVELITQIACEELRYPQRDPAASRQRYQRIAQALGFESHNAVHLRRTLRYYQSNADFLRAHQHAIAENSMRCLMLPEQVSTRQ